MMRCMTPSHATGSRTWSDLIMIARGTQQTPDCFGISREVFCLVPFVWIGRWGPQCAECCSNTQQHTSHSAELSLPYFQTFKKVYTLP